MKNTKEEIIKRLNAIAEQSALYNEKTYDVSIRDWENNGKSRTYFKVSCKDGKKFNQIDCGYFDNVTEEYIKGYKNLAADRIFDYGGNNEVKF